MKRIRRINVIGGPGSGKSLTATNIRSQLGFKGYNIELVDEIIKDWTYIPRIPVSCDGHYLQACQLQREDIRLRSGVDLVVTDSPLFLQFFFARHQNIKLQANMLLTSQSFDALYPALYIYLNRDDKFYKSIGRFEDLEEAKKIDINLKRLMDSAEIKFKEFSCLDQQGIIDYIILQLEENNG